MNSLWKFAYIAALALAVKASPVASAQTLQTIENGQPQLFIDAVDSYIYGYPLPRPSSAQPR
jgi:hypothetical protein